MSSLSSTTIWILVAVLATIFLFSLILNISLLKLSSTVLGGSLRHPKLRHFLTSLVLGNLVITLAGLPAWGFVLISQNTSQKVQLTEHISDIFYYTLDAFHCFLVILHILVLMVERLYAIGWPIQHRISPDLHDYVICALIWLTSAIFTTTAYLVNHFIDFQKLSLVVVATCFPLPIVMTFILFVVIIVKKNQNFTTEMRKKEFHLAAVIAVFTIVYVLLHGPLHVIYVLLNTIPTNHIPYYVTVMSLRCVQYSSSVFIPIVFMFGVAEFRSELNWSCFTCCSINEHSQNDFLQMDMPRLDAKCILTNASRNPTAKEQVELGFTNEVQSSYI